jgi:hypothetical protein
MIGLYDGLVDALEAALSLTVVRGWPRWGRPGATGLPLAALLVRGAELVPERAGRRSTRLSLQLALFAAHEPALVILTDAFLSWLAASHQITLAGTPARLTADAGERWSNEEGLDEEDHGLSFGLELTW